MRPVVFIAKSVAPMGGLEADMLKCIRALCEAGREVHVLYGFKAEGTDAALAGCNVQWHRMWMRKRPPLFGQLLMLVHIRRILTQLERQRGELFVINYERLPFGDVQVGAAPQQLWVAARKKMRLSPFSQLPYRSWLNFIDRHIQQQMACTLLIFSERDGEALRRLGVAENRIERVIIPTDTDRFAPSANETRPFITIVGANPKLKGIDLALAVWPQIHARHPELRLRVVTQGWKGRRLVEQSNLPGVEVADFIRDVERYYHDSRLLLAPSIFETWGNVVVEALACGVPVVAAADVPAGELLAGENCGVVFARDGVQDAAGLAAAIEQALAMPLDAASRAERHRHVRQFMTDHADLLQWMLNKA